MTKLTDDEFQNTYGETPLLRGSFDVDAATNYKCVSTAGIMCVTVTGCPFIPILLCCYPAMKKTVESQRITLGEHSLFYYKDTFCCCGPCMCKCTSTEQQVPLDKLQDLKLQQNFCQRWLDVWGMSMETAGQSGTESGPEMSLVGLHEPRRFKQQVLAQRNLLSSRAPGSYTAPKASAQETASAADLVPILLRIEQRLTEMPCQQQQKL